MTASRFVKKSTTKTSHADELTAANRAAAHSAGLSYVGDERPGIVRKNTRTSFTYFNSRGRRIRDAKTLGRIKSLVIPPAWKDVWISPQANGHIQAIGRDARGRKQYRYHPKWREARDDTKYHRMIDFGKALPVVRRKIRADLRRHGLPREKVLAVVVAIMEKTLIRVGNEEYANQNNSFGLTTLHDKHARVSSRKVRFEFRGKSGVAHEIDLNDPALARIVARCRDLPGEELFQYLDASGKVCDVKSADVNEYLRQISGGDFTAKDFRTWAGTLLAARALREFEKFDSQAQAKKNVIRAIESVAMKLGNTKAVCRKCYIHPDVINSYMDGGLAEALGKKAGKMLTRSLDKLSSEEAAVLALLSTSDKGTR